MKNDKLEFICKKCLPTYLANIEFHMTDTDGNVPLRLVNQGGVEFYHIPVTIVGVQRILIMEKCDFDQFGIEYMNTTVTFA